MHLGHFLTVDTSPLNLGGLECSKKLVEKAKVGGIPCMVFYSSSSVDTFLDRPLLRFAICKERQTIEEAAERIIQADFSSCESI